MAAVTSNAFLYPRARLKPDQSLVYRTVQTYWTVFLREQERIGNSVPHFIKDEFNDFLKCGIPEYGVVRTYCYQCRYSGWWHLAVSAGDFARVVVRDV